ncbi:hypothetical protein [Oscillibacter sp.]|uniref:hypothetical protein n=1 Tax=Oscillibacter sp. TaxID=1945593 RepID=UPI00289BD660|nr:hypothetical protein [Oscillibacter sp.]
MSGLARADLRDWQAFWRRWDKLIEALPEAKETALRMAGMAVLKDVQEQVDRRISDSHGRVKRWQSLKQSSGGGYVVVTSEKDEVVQLTKGGEKTTSSDVTRYLEKGHKARTPSGRGKLYRERLNENKIIASENAGFIVRGRMFYSWSKLRAGDLGREAAGKTLRKLKTAIEQRGSDLT